MSYYCDICKCEWGDANGWCNCFKCSCGKGYDGDTDCATESKIIRETFCEDCAEHCSSCDCYYPEELFCVGGDCIFCASKNAIMKYRKSVTHIEILIEGHPHDL